MEGLGTIAQGFTEGGRAHRDDHEFLQVEVVVGVSAAVDDVHHRHGQRHLARATEVAIQRQAGFLGSGAGHGHGDGQHGVGAQVGLVVGTVQLDQGTVDVGLLGGVQAQNGLGDLGVDVLDSFQHALAAIALGIAIAQLDGLTGTGRGAGRDGRTAHHARFEQDVAFDGGVATRIDDLTSDNVDDCTHWPFSSSAKPSTQIMLNLAVAPARTSRA